MSRATPKTTATHGIRISFANTPQAMDDQLVVREADDGYTLDVLANDLGGNAKQLWSLHASEPSEPQVTGQPTSLTLGGFGTLEIVNGAVVGFAPDTALADEINKLAEGQQGPSLEFWYVIRLANGAFAKAKATITFEGVNDAATIGGELAAEIDEDGFASGTVTVSDVDNGEAKFRPVDDADLQTDWGDFTFDPETGFWTFTPNDEADKLNVGDTRVVTLTVTSLDGTATETITVTITGTNDAAVLSSAAVTLEETDAPLSTSGTLTISDVDNPEKFVAQTATAGSYGVFAIDEDGNWSFTANSAFDHLNVGDTLSDTFTVSAVDGTTTTVTVTITGTNDAAVIAGDTAGSVTEDTVLIATGTLTAADVDNTPNTFQAASGSASYGTWSITTAGAWTYTLDNSLAAVQALNTGQTLSDSFDVFSADGTAQTISITINGLNEPVSNLPPVVQGETIYLSNQTSGIAFPWALFLANDSDPENTPLTIIAATATSSGWNSVGINATQQTITLATAPGASGTLTFNYTVQDQAGATATASVSAIILSTLNANSDDTWTIPANAIYVASWLDGQNGNDSITGSSGRDWLLGSQGADQLNGGPGDDVLTGGNGSDIFVFARGYGRDMIMDFQRTGQNLDRLDLDVTKAQLTFSNVDGNTIITSSAWEGTDQLILVGVTYTAATFDASWII